MSAASVYGMSTDFAAAGLGLQQGTVRLVPAKRQWAAVADQLAAEIRSALPGVAAAVAHIGSTAIPGLLAKPVIDLAVAVPAEAAVEDIAGPMARLGWLYRGDAGPDGGWTFVLDDAPGRRVAHAHAVEHGGGQWLRYLQFRELLRSSSTARQTYEAMKRNLAEQHPDARRDYTAGKAIAVQQLLSGHA